MTAILIISLSILFCLRQCLPDVAKEQKDEVLQASSGGYFTVVLTKNREVKYWGIGSRHTGGETIRCPEKLDYVTCGGYHCIGLANQSGRVYSITFPQSQTKDYEFHSVIGDEDFESQRFVRIAAGFNHSIAITEKGEVYTWGENRFGKLGRGMPGNTSHINVHDTGGYLMPRRLPLFETTKEKVEFKDACGGGEFTLLLDTHGRVWSFGSNTSGQLGRFSRYADHHESDDNQKQQQQQQQHLQFQHQHRTEQERDQEEGQQQQDQQRQEKLAFDPVPSMISLHPPQAFFGRDHEGEKEKNSSQDNNSNEQEQRDEHQQRHRDSSSSSGSENYALSFSPLSVPVDQIACGGDHALLVTRAGDVYSFGWGEMGQLGHGDFLDQSLPRRISSLISPIVQVAAGGYGHSLLLSNEGEVYSFGWNEDLQLGLLTTDPTVPTPTLVSMLRDETVLSIDNNHGFKHSFFVIAEKSGTDAGARGIGKEKSEIDDEVKREKSAVITHRPKQEEGEKKKKQTQSIVGSESGAGAIVKTSQGESQTEREVTTDGSSSVENYNAIIASELKDVAEAIEESEKQKLLLEEIAKIKYATAVKQQATGQEKVAKEGGGGEKTRCDRPGGCGQWKDVGVDTDDVKLRVIALGDNSYGQLVDVTTESLSRPPPPPTHGLFSSREGKRDTGERWSTTISGILVSLVSLGLISFLVKRLLWWKKETNAKRATMKDDGKAKGPKSRKNRYHVTRRENRISFDSLSDIGESAASYQGRDTNERCKHVSLDVNAANFEREHEHMHVIDERTRSTSFMAGGSE